VEPLRAFTGELQTYIQTVVADSTGTNIAVEILLRGGSTDVFISRTGWKGFSEQGLEQMEQEIAHLTPVIFSPQGRYLALEGLPDGGYPDIYVYDLRAKTLFSPIESVADSSFGSPRWIDENHLLVVRAVPFPRPPELWRIDLTKRRANRVKTLTLMGE
jgi:hypothetical protein